MIGVRPAVVPVSLCDWTRAVGASNTSVSVIRPSPSRSIAHHHPSRGGRSSESRGTIPQDLTTRTMSRDSDDES